MQIGMSLGMRKPSGLTTIQRALAVLRKFGTDAHIWLPGVGSINGLTAANYLLSDASTGLAPVDQYVGLASDALGGLGVELVTVGGISGAAIGGPTFTNYIIAPDTVIDKWYEVRYTVSGYAGTGTVGIAGSTTYWYESPLAVSSNGEVRQIIRAKVLSTPRIFTRSTNTANFSNISVREVTGIAATQPTTANKPKLVRGAVNLLTYSRDFSNAAWTKTAGAVANSATQVSLPVLGAKAQQTTAIGSSSVGTAWTAAYLLSGSGSVNLYFFDNGGSWPATSLANITLTSTPTLYVINRTHTDAAATSMAPQITTGTSAVVDIGGIGAFKGTLTAAQIQALGGIPLTLTAPVSTALGPYWWDTTGGKSLSVTFPAGYESATVIDAAKTGQVTQTAQNVVGAYNITTPTHGRFVINASLTTTELTLLQKLANSLAGL